MLLLPLVPPCLKFCSVWFGDFCREAAAPKRADYDVAKRCYSYSLLPTPLGTTQLESECAALSTSEKAENCF